MARQGDSSVLRLIQLAAPDSGSRDDQRAEKRRRTGDAPTGTISSGPTRPSSQTRSSSTQARTASNTGEELRPRDRTSSGPIPATVPRQERPSPSQTPPPPGTRPASAPPPATRTASAPSSRTQSNPGGSGRQSLNPPVSSEATRRTQRPPSALSPLLPEGVDPKTFTKRHLINRGCSEVVRASGELHAYNQLMQAGLEVSSLACTLQAIHQGRVDQLRRTSELEGKVGSLEEKTENLETSLAEAKSLAEEERRRRECSEKTLAEALQANLAKEAALERAGLEVRALQERVSALSPLTEELAANRRELTRARTEARATEVMLEAARTAAIEEKQKYDESVNMYRDAIREALAASFSNALDQVAVVLPTFSAASFPMLSPFKYVQDGVICEGQPAEGESEEEEEEDEAVAEEVPADQSGASSSAAAAVGGAAPASEGVVPSTGDTPPVAGGDGENGGGGSDAGVVTTTVVVD